MATVTNELANRKYYLNLRSGYMAPVTLHCSYGDSGETITFYILDGGDDVDLTGASVSIHGTRVDGANFGPFICTVEGNSVSFELQSSMTAVEGGGIAEFIISKNGATIGTCNFGILVENATFPNGVAYDTDPSVYQDILKYVQSIPASLTSDYTSKINIQKQRIDTYLSSGTAATDSELIDVRVGYDASEYTLAGNAVREQISDTIKLTNTDIIWEVGNISTGTGAKVSRTDCMRTNLIPVEAGDIASIKRIDNVENTGWFANIHYYNSSGIWIGAYRDGASLTSNNINVIPTEQFLSARFVRFTILNTNGNASPQYSSIYEAHVYRQTSKEIVIGKTEDRLSGNITGAKNLFDISNADITKSDQFLLRYQIEGNVITNLYNDYFTWGYANSQLYLTLSEGTYHLYFHFIENIGSEPVGVGYAVYTETQDIAISNVRLTENYDIEHSFTITETEQVGIQFKVYVGNKFAFYLYKDECDTLLTLSNKVNSMIESGSGDPTFNNIYSEPIQNLVKKYDATVGAGNVGYIWISDLHINSLYQDRNKALKRQLMACAEIANRTNIQFICIGGDIIDREESHDTIYSIFNEAFSGISNSRKPIVVLTGNHDDNPYTNPVPFTKSQVKGLFVNMAEVDRNEPNADSCYYYFEKAGYRFICLDMIDYPAGYNGMSWWGYSEAQAKWLADMLLTNDKKSIILSHMTLDSDHNAWDLGNNGGYTTDIKDIIDAYNNRSSITKYGSTYDYTNVTGKILYVHAGHSHFDEIDKENGRTTYNLVTSCAKNETAVYAKQIDGNLYEASNDEEYGGHWNTTGWRFYFYPNRTLETINEATFDVVSVGTNTVNVFRLGAGVDRSFTI